MLKDVKLKAKKQLGNLFAKENDSDLCMVDADRTNVLKQFIQGKLN